MLKMYHKNPHSGNTPDYWANSWDGIEFEQALKLCSTDPLQATFNKYIEQDSLFLEGGCGKGHWVAYFSDKNYKIIGLDFAHRTLVELNDNQKGLSLCCGNVDRLPFAANTFDAYYSGGVVEHFEGGCENSLNEARRVLKDDGVLLISVPYFSPLRRLLTPLRRNEWRTLSQPEVDKTAFSEDLTYFQYLYRIDEFKKMLSNAGLETIETQGYSIMWGLYDLKFMNRRASRKIEASKQAAADSTLYTPASALEGQKHTVHSYIRHLLIGEDTSTFLSRTATRFMRWSCANMMMFVCRKK